MNFIRLRISISVLLVVSFLTWATSASSEEVLSLDRLLGMARNTHPEMIGQALSPEIAHETQERLRGSQDWNLLVSGDSSYAKPLPSPIPGTPDSDLRFGLSAELTKADWNTGSRVTLGASSGYRDSSFVLDSFSQFQNRIFAEYSISLMRNARGILDRLAFDLAAYDVDLVQIESDENQEAFLLELGSLFLDWVLLKEEVRILDTRLGIAREEVERTKRMRGDNLVEAVDVLRAEDSERLVSQARLLVYAQLRATRVQLATRMGDQSILQMAPSHDIYAMHEQLSDELIARRIRENVRPIQQLNVARDQLVRARDGFENSEQPNLTLVAGGALAEANKHYDDALLMDRPEAYLLLRWSKPLGNRTAKAELRRADLQLIQLEHRKHSVEMQLQSIAFALTAHMSELENVLDLNRQQIESAARRTQEELKLYNQGRGELNFVLASRDNESQAEFTYAENAAAYQKLEIQLRELVDDLL